MGRDRARRDEGGGVDSDEEIIDLIDLTDNAEPAPVELDAVARVERKWRTLLESTTDTVTLLDRYGNVQQTTGEFTDVLGYPSSSWAGRSGYELIHPDEIDQAIEAFTEVVAQPRRMFTAVFRTLHADGHYELIEYNAVNRLDDPLIQAVVVTTRNVTELRRAQALVADEAAILECIARGASLDQTMQAISDMVEYHTGGTVRVMTVPAEQTVDGTWTVPIVDTGNIEVLGAIVVDPRMHRDPDESESEVLAVAGHLAGIAIERDRDQRRLVRQARYDQLTGLPNRWAIVERLEAALERSRHPTGGRVAVLLVDLDRFKVVNDGLGHAVGDELLVAFGERLAAVAHRRAFVGHFGADEFVVILEGLVDGQSARRFATEIGDALLRPFTVSTLDMGEPEIFLSASVGLVHAGPDDTPHHVLQHADAAMYRAKERGRDRVEVFNDDMQAEATAQLRLDRELRAAVERGELELHYQPKIDLTSGTIIGVEALLRWAHPDRGLVLPSEFIPAAEQTGLIVRIGDWVIDQAVQQARRWLAATDAIDRLSVAVNLSARQLTAPGLVASVARVLERYHWPAADLTLELTESILVDDATAALAVLRDLKLLGVKLAIDDFGTGYSSLSYLHQFPVDIVKVDRAFVQTLRADGEGSAIATAVTRMAHALGLIAAAEGVEQGAQLAGLRNLGCDWAQGFLFSRAVPPDTIAELLGATPRW